MIAYRATLDVPREPALYPSRLLRAERRRCGTRKGARALTCSRHAVLVLRWSRQNTDITALARDHGISRATGYRYLDEVTPRSPSRHRTCTTPWSGPRMRAQRTSSSNGQPH
ncbi:MULTISPECIES: hypothetical protein [unclassified Saccharothrix]|uniref:hypothetical protein n=1 Tax=unclassified Saccharothrix TaxID=2593673 RepID=UPI00307E5513